MNKKIKILTLILIISILLTSCSLPGLKVSSNKNNIIIASGNTTERQILSEMVSQMIEHYTSETKPELINNLGSTMLVVQALKREDANISGANYTGTSLTGELELEPTTNRDEALENVIKGYNDKFNMVWFPSYGFENTYAFMMSKEKAEKLNIKKVSDLEEYKDDFKIGIDTAWYDREQDGYEAFINTYGFEFENIMPMEIGLVYGAINNESMDVALGYSTDGRIDAYDLIILEDDLNLFPPYDASPVVTKKILKKHPEIETVLLKLEGEISSNTMQKLNRISDEEKIEPIVVAKRFLVENNYFEDKQVIPLREREIYKDIMKDIIPNRGGKKWQNF